MRGVTKRKLVDVRREGALAVVTLAREEKLNALSQQLETELAAAIEGRNVRDSRVVILTGAGRAFSAGADVGEMRVATPAGILEYYRELGEMYEAVARLPQPTITAIHGYCLGGGLELALATDFRVADRTAVFGLPEVAIGILPSSGGTHRLVRLVGPGRAKEVMLLRERFDADQALRLGVVTEVVEEGRALDRALEMGGVLAQLPSLAVELTKRATDLMAESSREVGLMIERLTYAVLSQTEAHQDATRRFTERASPSKSAGP